MLSRVADSVYWMSRYIERAENIARLIDVNLSLTLDLPDETDSQWQAVVITTGDAAGFARKHDSPSADAVIDFLVFDQDNPNSIICSLKAARENARTVREIISSETWEQVNRFYMTVNDASRALSPLDLGIGFFQQIRLSSHLIEGVVNTTMSHDEAWHFTRLGRLLERGEQTARLLDTKYFLLLPSADYVGSTVDDIQWSAVLRSASAFEMYRKRHGRIDPHRVIDFLLLNREFPRSTHYCILKADESLHQITGTEVGAFRDTAERELGRLRWEFAFSNAGEIIEGGLHQYLDGLQTKFSRVGDSIFATFFAPRHAPISVPVTEE